MRKLLITLLLTLPTFHLMSYWQQSEGVPQPEEKVFPEKSLIEEEDKQEAIQEDFQEEPSETIAPPITEDDFPDQKAPSIQIESVIQTPPDPKYHPYFKEKLKKYLQDHQSIKKDAIYHYNLSHLLIRLGRTREAEIEIQKTLQMNPRFLFADLQLAYVYYWREESNKSLALFRKRPFNSEVQHLRLPY